MRSLVLTLTLALALIAVAGCARPAQEDTDVYRRAALKAASWLQANALERPEGTVWAADPQDSTTVTTNLYSGSSGVVLFFLEAYRATGQPAYLDEARAGADYLLATLPDSLEEGQSGLYTGVAGLGFVLEETYRATDEVKYHDGAVRCVDLIKKAAQPTEHGLTWSGVTDIVSGSAGTGLFLLYAAERIGHPDALDLAVQAGRELIAQRIAEADGAKWAMENLGASNPALDHAEMVVKINEELNKPLIPQSLGKISSPITISARVAKVKPSSGIDITAEEVEKDLAPAA